LFLKNLLTVKVPKIDLNFKKSEKYSSMNMNGLEIRHNHLESDKIFKFMKEMLKYYYNLGELIN